MYLHHLKIWKSGQKHVMWTWIDTFGSGANTVRRLWHIQTSPTCILATGLIEILLIWLWYCQITTECADVMTLCFRFSQPSSDKGSRVTLQYYPLSSSCVSPLLQDSGRRPEELLNPAEYMSYQRVCNMEHFPESQPAPAYPPVTFLPQHPYQQHPPTEPMYSNTSFPAPVPQAPFKFPKEQSVWHAT